MEEVQNQGAAAHPKEDVHQFQDEAIYAQGDDEEVQFLEGSPLGDSQNDEDMVAFQRDDAVGSRPA